MPTRYSYTAPNTHPEHPNAPDFFWPAPSINPLGKVNSLKISARLDAAKGKKTLARSQQGKVMQSLFHVPILPGTAGKSVAQNNQKKLRGYAE